MKAGVLLFPGTNCDEDLLEILRQDFSVETEVLWHTEPFEPRHDFYFLPGGFSYGDYLRSGAMAAQSRCLSSLREARQQGRMIVGICNGFQVLTESHMLPGALIRNASLKHICKWVGLAGQGAWKSILPNDYALPISHSEGNYICSDENLKRLQDGDQIFMTYQDNPNGAIADIAGISDEDGRVLGLMPHPERAMRPHLDGEYGDRFFGRLFFEHLLSQV